ncbi:MAG: acylphosphatase [Rhodobacteraceae bacterium]|nr:acylphosphatase [Paracoccaceae bacterium]
MDQRTVRLLISGCVQGVGYRAWAVRAATGLGLSGWVRNLTDGRVEALASGSTDAVGAFIDACREGPRFAKVREVMTEGVEEVFSEGGFVQRATGDS